ncbi:hypothetical protein B296_00050458 [Ensete ventricosum]|uniref:Uncharacterized protein n=1 Tax=Ensete ventricosum TaxID=4639 RepID=A0A426X8K1_ENSVE|nr:hypothetical protein B296_00050458 [Ensete ventricosum]
MLIEDGSEGDLDCEATAMVEEEDGSGNVGCGSMVILQGRRGCSAKVWLRQRDEGAVECTVIAEEGSDDMERETTVGHVQFVTSHNQGSWQRKIATGSICAVRDRCWLRSRRTAAKDSYWQHCVVRDHY